MSDLNILIPNNPLEDHLARNKGKAISFEEMVEMCLEDLNNPPSFVLHTYSNIHKPIARHRIAYFDFDRISECPKVNGVYTKIPLTELEFYLEAKPKNTYLLHSETVVSGELKSTPQTEIYLMGKVDLSQRPLKRIVNAPNGKKVLA